MAQNIEQLNVQQVARHAFNVFLFSGRHQTGARLIYHALRIDSKNPEALRCLSDFLDTEGTQVFSGAVLEYALSESTGIKGDDRKTLDDLRFLAKWSWGFSLHKSNNPHLAQDAFANRALFIVDEARYQAFLAELITRAGSLDKAFTAAHTLCGAMAGFLTHRELGGEAGINESISPEKFLITPTYAEWLKSSTSELDALESERLKKSGVKKPWWKAWP
jgi:hypothetical protein